jgi:hypothetical protein
MFSTGQTADLGAGRVVLVCEGIDHCFVLVSSLQQPDATAIGSTGDKTSEAHHTHRTQDLVKWDLTDRLSRGFPVWMAGNPNTNTVMFCTLVFNILIVGFQV